MGDQNISVPIRRHARRSRSRACRATCWSRSRSWHLPDFVLHWLFWLVGLSWLLVLGFAAFHFVLALALIIPTWRVCVRAGFSGAWALLHLLPVIGSFIVM